MNAETLAIARRLVACKGWEWLPGMAAVGDILVGRCNLAASHRVTMVTQHGPWTTIGRQATVSGSRTRHAIIDSPTPDLDDELTRLGVLAVVRRALGVPTLTTLALGVSEPEPGEVVPEWRLAGIPDSMPELWRVRGASEIEVLCRALEAAQQ